MMTTLPDHKSVAPGALSQLSACLHLFSVSARRLLRSRQTMVCLLLLGFAIIAVVAWSMRRERSPEEFIQDVILSVYVPFLLPVFCLSYGCAGIAADREEQTLVYLLASPLPRPLIYLAKGGASLLLALAWTIGGLTAMCVVAGEPGDEALPMLWPAILSSTATYVSLFLMFSVLFRRATIIALGYALFIETLIGNMPGIAKRLAVSFYTRCQIYDAASEIGVGPSGPGGATLFAAIPGPTAQMVLWILTGGMLLAGLLIFCRSEYSE